MSLKLLNAEEGSRKEGLAQNFIIILPPHFFPLCVIILIPSKLYNRQSLHCSENFSLSSTGAGECRNKVMHLQDLCHKSYQHSFIKPFGLKSISSTTDPKQKCATFSCRRMQTIKHPKQLSWERYFIIHQTWDCLTKQCLEDASFRKRQDGGIAIAHPQSRLS